MVETAVTYHCPNCAAPLAFDPGTGRFSCEYCRSEFTKEELDDTETARQAEEAASEAAERAAEESEIPDNEFCAQIRTYVCSSCGAEIMADNRDIPDAVSVPDAATPETGEVNAE